MNVLVIDFAYFHLAGTLEIFHLIRFSPSGDLEMRSGLEPANWGIGITACGRHVFVVHLAIIVTHVQDTYELPIFNLEINRFARSKIYLEFYIHNCIQVCSSWSATDSL